MFRRLPHKSQTIMFQNLRPNNTLYILHRGAAHVLECGKVVTVKNLRTVYKNTPNTLYPQPIQVVDIVASVSNGDTVTITEMPANLDIADDVKNGILVSASREEMNVEILTMKQKSEEILKSVEYHKKFLSSCEQMLCALNPEVVAKQQQEKEILDLKSQMSEMSRNMADLMTLNKQLMEQFGLGSDTSKTKK